ncbi:zinc finger protein 497 [Syngnathus scovelli]|uniref:zinc finger protein 497 n=1 Tax=Syngnathus scovelli TaxID=161590 RepID=UPI002110D98F|nr:zinc finger protein 83 [Syngnathus scovelli]
MAAMAAAPPRGGEDLHVLVRKWQEVACQWEAPAGGTLEVGCQSDIAQSRDVGVQTDLLTRRLSWRRAGFSGIAVRRLALRANRQNGDGTLPQSKSKVIRTAVKAQEVSPADVAGTVSSSPSPPLSGGRPRRTRRPPRWREDLQTPAMLESLQKVAAEDEEDQAVQTLPQEGAAAADAKLEGESIMCDVCGQVMKNKSSLARHSFIHTGKKPFACHLCDLRFNRRDNLSHHLSRLHPGGVARREKRRPVQTWLCDVCGKTFRCRSALKTHEVIHLGVKPHRCDLCPKSYMRTNDLQHHKLTVHQDGEGDGSGTRRRSGSLLCHFCGKELKFRSQLAAHLQTHTDERPHLCDVCGRKFCRRYQLERHKVLVHVDGGATEDEEGSLPCSVCGKRLKTEALLAAHLRMHSGDKPFRCTLCLRRFMRHACLKRHYARAHMKEGSGAAARSAGLHQDKSFPCTTCGKVFKFRSLLSNHAAVHSDERPHACDFCPRRFRRLSHLKRHRRVVHRDGARLPQNFVCHICGKDKKCRSQLARHVIIHTGERPFGCDMCAARFNRRGNLQQHRKRVHGIHPTPEEADPPVLFPDLDEDCDYKLEDTASSPAD